jgi:hypothetical protein
MQMVLLMLLCDTVQAAYHEKRSEGPNRVGVPPQLRLETDPVSITLCSLVFTIPDDG